VPSTTTVRPSERARCTIDDTITHTLRSFGMACTNERSTFSVSTEKRCRYDSDE